MIICCQKCNKEFKIVPARIKTAKYCSYSCSNSIRTKSKEFIICTQCNKSFKNKYWHHPKFCSRKCSQLNQTKNERICPICNTQFRSYRTNLNKGMGKFCSMKCSGTHQKQNGTRKEIKNSQWKGEGAGYSGKHYWVNRWKGKPTTCEYCGKTGLKGKQIQWANKDHKYKRNLNDWLRLCSKCHAIYDKQLNLR